MTFSKHQLIVDLLAQTQICRDLLGLPLEQLENYISGNDVSGEAVAKAAYLQIAKINQA